MILTTALLNPASNSYPDPKPNQTTSRTPTSDQKNQPTMCLTLTTKHPLCGCLTTTTFTPCRLIPWNRCLRREMIIVEGTRRRNNLLCEACSDSSSNRYSERRMNRLYTLMACLEGFDSDGEFDCLDVDDEQHGQDDGVQEFGVGGHDDYDGGDGGSDGSSDESWYGDGEGDEGEGDEEEYIEESSSSEEELVVLRCDLSRVCDSIASSRVCHGTGALGREKRRFGRGRVRGPKRRDTADEEAMEMDMAMARAKVEDQRVSSTSTVSSL
ncbi:hypothetical protein BO83DRAFT_453380 [Aspergillus eucalypticola CBS 122712]|uniref:Uncharacterized protein n=1 Tax=Aspergillus eucalypticola (strain CBS 122712 / IBT 29274) TaxID=1448314 RepID=A0A317UU19_ASPEC|nr:uncharacterized protein BO83DRAFT_453380 [Aspergillus eucalypticola CBS 122712]PWY65095.1 hypothetical protein BO83DRAFT_453380 [Aspergillus eucalypticola CBS 122712]